MGTFIMTVSGSNFTTGSVVKWNGTNVSTGYVSSTQLSATIVSSLIANIGTATITVYTSGRKGGTSNSKSFAILTPTTTAPPPPPPPPPAPTPLSITTSSLPSSTAGSTFSASVAASGGTPSYFWGLVNGGGSLPPGLALQANGTIGGTPTQAGTFTFTTQAGDSASQIAQKVLSITVGALPATEPPPPTTSGIIFQDGFENGFTPWGSVTDPRVQVNTNPSFARSGGKSAQIYYYICGDSTNTACRSSHQDDNHNIQIHRPEGLRHFFLRGYFYIKRPEAGATVDGLGRKLFYIWADPSGPGNLWSVMVSVRGTGGINSMSFTQQNYPLGGGTYVSDCGTTNPPPITGAGCNIQYDTWYSLELELKNNTALAAPWNGYARIWVNGEKVYDVTAWSFNRQYDYPIKLILIGDQVDRANYNPVNEYRYWDDIVLSTTYIGP